MGLCPEQRVIIGEGGGYLDKEDRPTFLPLAADKRVLIKDQNQNISLTLTLCGLKNAIFFIKRVARYTHNDECL